MKKFFKGLFAKNVEIERLFIYALILGTILFSIWSFFYLNISDFTTNDDVYTKLSNFADTIIEEKSVLSKVPDSITYTSSLDSEGEFKIQLSSKESYIEGITVKINKDGTVEKVRENKLFTLIFASLMLLLIMGISALIPFRIIVKIVYFVKKMINNKIEKEVEKRLKERDDKFIKFTG